MNITSFNQIQWIVRSSSKHWGEGEKSLHIVYGSKVVWWSYFREEGIELCFCTILKELQKKLTTGLMEANPCTWHVIENIVLKANNIVFMQGRNQQKQVLFKILCNSCKAPSLLLWVMSAHKKTIMGILKPQVSW